MDGRTGAPRAPHPGAPRPDPARPHSRGRRSCPAPGASRRRPWRAPSPSPRPPRAASRRSARPARRRARARRRPAPPSPGSRSSRGQVLHVEQPLEDPVVEPRLAELVAVEDRPDALPALLEEVAQRRVRLEGVDLLDAVEDAGGPVDAEPALARAHAEAQAAADVVEVRRLAPAHGLLQARARDELALADELVVEQVALLGRQALAEVVRLAVLRAWQDDLVRAARALLAELRAHRVDDVLRHQPQRRQLAAGDREEPVDAVARAV